MMVSLKEILGIAGKLKLKLEGLPKHIAFTAVQSVPSDNIENFIEKSWGNLENTINVCTKLNIPIVTFFLLPVKKKELERKDIEYLSALFKKLDQSEDLEKKQIKVSVLGKWYDLPSGLVEEIKTVIEKTKDYDRFFVNICLNYNGQDEIVGACRLLARQVKLGKLEPEAIDSGLIKANLYSSYFIPPELVILTGGSPITRGLLLWDSSMSRFFFINKPWRDLETQDLLDALEYYQNNQ